MRKKLLIVFALIPILVNAQEVKTIQVLFDSLKTHPQTISGEILKEKAKTGKRVATGMLFPKVDGFATYGYSSDPTGMMPIAPNDLLMMVKDPTTAQPFSQNIMRLGGEVSMPIFSMAIYRMASKAKSLYKSADKKSYIDLLQNEAMIVGLNANLKYINSMIGVLKNKKVSIEKTKEIITIKVNNQRAPKSVLLKINDALNQIELAKSNVELKKAEVVSTLKSLTGIKLDNSIPIKKVATLADSSIAALDPLKLKIKAEELGKKAEADKLLPMVAAKLNYNHALANAYNNDKSVNTDYMTVNLFLKLPIFEKSQYSKIKMAKLGVTSLQNDLAQKELELSSQAEALKSNLKILENQQTLYNQSIKDKEGLLKVAKVAYSNERMTIEDYLKYEDELALEQAKGYKAEAEKWQTLMKLAVIYGNSIEKLVK